jgi:hypothetical protein
MTIGGIISGIGTGLVGIPITVTTYYAQIVKDGVPHWFSALTLPMILLGFVMAMVGTVVLGIAGKGADEHSTVAQVEASTETAVVNQVNAAVQANPAKIPPVPVVIVDPKVGK